MTGNLCQIEGGVDGCEHIGDIKEEVNKAGHPIQLDMNTFGYD